MIFCYGSSNRLIHKAIRFEAKVCSFTEHPIYWVSIMCWILRITWWHKAGTHSPLEMVTQNTCQIPTLQGEAMPCHERRLTWRRSGEALLKKLLLTWRLMDDNWEVKEEREWWLPRPCMSIRSRVNIRGRKEDFSFSSTDQVPGSVVLWLTLGTLAMLAGVG